MGAEECKLLFLLGCWLYFSGLLIEGGGRGEFIDNIFGLLLFLLVDVVGMTKPIAVL